MQGGIFSYGLLAALAIALLAAAFTDLRRRQIDNWLNAAIALAAPLFWLASGLAWADVVWQLALAAGTFAVLFALFAMRMMGGGDVKLLTALALWFPAHQFTQLIFVMALLGGALSVGQALPNMKRIETERVRNALAFAGGGLWLLLSAYALYIMAGGPGLPIGPAIEWLVALPAGVWLTIGLGVIVFAIMTAGVVHLARRQQDRIKIPYGLAISGAGLWVLASQCIPAIQAGTHSG